MHHSDYGCTPSFLDGTVGHHNWYYSIGIMNNCNFNFSGSMPCWTDIGVKEVILYVTNNATYKSSLLNTIYYIILLLFSS